MIKKKVLIAERVRGIEGGFSFIPHRFLTDGFLASLNPYEILLYFFLVLCGDRNGLSFYSYDKICTLLQMSLEQYIQARDGLIKRDLIAFDGTIYQVLSLPRHVTKKLPRSIRRSCERKPQPEPIGQILSDAFKDPSDE